MAKLEGTACVHRRARAKVIEQDDRAECSRALWLRHCPDPRTNSGAAAALGMVSANAP